MGDWFTEGGSGATVDVVSLLDSKAGTLLHEAMDSGALVSVGLTSDGGSLGVTVTVDGAWRREYFRDSDDLSEWLARGLPAIRDAVASAKQRRVSSAQRSRRRGL